MKRSIKTIAAAALAAVMCVSFAGCDNRSPLEKEIENAFNEFNKQPVNPGQPSDQTSVTKPEPEQLDPFKGLDVIFDGIAPNGKVTVKNGSSYVKYTPDLTSGLRNGDVVTVTAELKSSSYEERYVLTETKKQFTVEGLTSYVEKLADVPQADMDKMDQNIRDSFNDYYSGGSSSSSIVVKDGKPNSMELLGNYLLCAKDMDAYSGSKNELFYVYKVSGDFARRNFPDNVETLDYYFCAYYRNVKIMPDGSVPIGSDSLYFGSYSGNVKLDMFYMDGASESLDVLFAKNIADKTSKYDFESTVKE